MAWQSARSIEAIFLVSDCRGCSRLYLAQILGLAPGKLRVERLA